MSKKQAAPQTTTQTSAQEQESSSNTSGGMGNQAMSELRGGSSEQAPAVDLSNVSGANGFMRAASAALDAAVPVQGSYSSLSVSGNIPLWSDPSGSAKVILAPSLKLQAARTSADKFEVTISTALALTAKASRSLGWFGKFEAFMSAKASGSLKLVGDSAAEIFDEFMLTLREVIDGACGAAGVPNNVADALRQGIMSDSAREATIQNMDENDGVTATFGLGGSLGGKAGGIEGSAGIDYSHTTSLKNDGNNQLDTSSSSKTKTSLTLKGTFKTSSLPVKSIKPSLTIILGDGGVSEVFVGLGTSGAMDSNNFSAVALMSTEWAHDMGMAIKSLVQGSLGTADRSTVAQLSQGMDALAFGSEAVTYTAFGDELKAMGARNPGFQDLEGTGQSMQKIEFGLSGQAGWTRSKGWYAKGALTSAKSWTLGSSKTPLKVEAKSGQTIASAKAG